ncbi:MAG: bifunctional metallophosphatase/5'-nucleotidase [bacterium]|nr:MAG: bifunctional metallophosphatase/5'-nucleotidase [bacterium]
MSSNRILRMPPGAVAALLALLLLLPCCSKEEKGRSRDTVDLTIIYSSDLVGKIRSCGCTVEDMGGLGRRATYIERVRENVSNLLVLDAGDAFSLDLSYSQAEAGLTIEAFDLMGLDAFTPGEIEFIFGLDNFKRLTAGTGFDILAVNVVDPGTHEPVFGPAYKVVELEGGFTVGITGVLDESIRFPNYIDRSMFAILPAAETLRRIMPELEERADFLILLSHFGLERSKALAEEVPGFDIVVVGHGKPIVKKVEKVGESFIVATGGAGQYIGRIDLSLLRDGGYSFGRMRLVPLSDEIEIHEDVKGIFRRYGIPLTDKEAKAQ